MNTPTPQPNLPSFVDVVANSLSRFAGMPETMATALAMSIATTAAELGYGGTDYYLPGLPYLTRVERDARIRSEWTGKNVKHLCRKFGLSRTQIYVIVRRASADSDS